MQEKEKQIIETFAFIIPKLSENSKNYLLGLGEGIAIQLNSQQQQQEQTYTEMRRGNDGEIRGRK